MLKNKIRGFLTENEVTSKNNSLMFYVGDFGKSNQYNTDFTSKKVSLLLTKVFCHLSLLK